MLLSRFIILKNVYFDLIRRAAREDFNDKNKVSYLIKVFDMIQQNIISLQLDKKEFQDDLLNLEKEINGYIDRLVELYLQDYFQNLVDFVRKYAGEESEKEMNKLNAGENMLIKQENNEIVIKQSGHQVNFRLIENIAQELSDGWNKRVETVRKESENVFSGAACLKIIIKKFLTALLAYYNTFFKYVKQNHSSFCSQMVPVHQFMKENSVILKNYQM